jgi:diaminopimelate decarboxylase
MIARQTALALAEEFGTPLYVYDLGEVEARTTELRSLLPRDARLLYSLKANPLPSVAESARIAGCGAEISSEGELAAAHSAGFEPASMLYTGPAKTDRELRRAVAAGVGWFSAESMSDLDRIAAAARQAATTVPVLLRLNPVGAPRAQLAMTGIPSQFGFAESELPSLAARVRALGGIEVAGAHVYLGTQAAGAAALAQIFNVAVAAAERLAASFALRVLDLGGGFPWPFATDGVVADLAPLAAALQGVLASREATSCAEVWFESGRYVAASSGTLLARVVDVKRSGDTTFYVLDAGIATLGGMSGLGRVLRPEISLTSVKGEPSGEPIIADVVGPLCTPLDCLARDARVPAVEPGELVAIPNVGAYGATASLSAFLSRPTTLEVSVHGGEVVAVARLRGGHEPLPRAKGAT